MSGSKDKSPFKNIRNGLNSNSKTSIGQFSEAIYESFD